MNHKIEKLFGLKFNPFVPEVPLDALYISPRVENFLWRIENALMREVSDRIWSPPTSRDADSFHD